jgi:hypothetical protein
MRFAPPVPTWPRCSAPAAAPPRSAAERCCATAWSGRGRAKSVPSGSGGPGPSLSLEARIVLLIPRVDNSPTAHFLKERVLLMCRGTPYAVPAATYLDLMVQPAGDRCRSEERGANVGDRMLLEWERNQAHSAVLGSKIARKCVGEGKKGNRRQWGLKESLQ